MGKRSKVVGLPPDVKKWLDDALVENNFSQYELLATELAKLGFEISKSSLQRYGSPFERQLANVRLAGEQAKAVIDASPDDDNAMNDALIRLTQQKLFVLLAEAEQDERLSPKLLGQITKAIADLARASIQQKKYQAEVRARTAAAAENAGTIAKAGGASDDTIDRIKREIMGIPA